VHEPISLGAWDSGGGEIHLQVFSAELLRVRVTPPKRQYTPDSFPPQTTSSIQTTNYYNPTMADPDPQPAVVAALATDASATPSASNTTEQKIDPWNVAGEVGADGKVKAIDYFKLVEEFGTKRINKEDLARFEKVTGHKPHRFMRRGIVFSHRDLNLILDRHEKGEPFFLYTGRGPSSDSMHIGHTVPFEFTK